VAGCSIGADEDVLRQFPFPYRLTLTFRLAGTRLRVDVEAQNLGTESMPLGFGWHPYFRLPLIPGGDRGVQAIHVPAARLWKLDAELIPTGETIAVPPERDFRRSRPIGTTNLDDVYTDVQRSDGQSACTLTDPASGVTLRIAAGPSFREWVVFAPPHRPTICFEPYTCPTDAFNLAARGQDVGVIVLRLSERWADWMELDLGASA
jgi:aldose 1-epimerase